MINSKNDVWITFGNMIPFDGYILDWLSGCIDGWLDDWLGGWLDGFVIDDRRA